MKKSKKNKKRLLLLAALLAVVSLIAGTFAWLTATDARINRVKSAYVTDGSVTITEKFNPSTTEIIPGGKTEKVVSVTNAGNAPVYVRASFEEVMKYLQASKSADASVTKYVATAEEATAPWALASTDKYETQGLGKAFPVLSSLKESGTPAALPTEFKGAKKITGVYTDGSTFPADTALYVKGNAATDPLDPTKTVYSVDAELFTKVEIIKDETNTKETRYQVTTGKVTFDATKAAANPTDVTQWDVKVDKTVGLKYKVYPNGYKYGNSNWAESKIGRKTDAADKAAVLGSKGTLYGQAYDYTSPSIIGAVAAPDLTTTNYPTAASQTKPAKVQGVNAADITATSDNTINLNYGAAIVDPALSTNYPKDSWVYNAEDGWFYYTSPVQSGTATKNLLESLSYGNNIGDETSGAIFDLVVKIEAIQFSDEALSDTTAGWGLPTTGKVYTSLIANK